MMAVADFVKQVQDKEVDVADHIAKVIAECKKLNKEYHYLNVISEELALEQAQTLNLKGKLAGVAVSIKDSICVGGVESTAGSRILEGYKPPFHSTVVSRIIKEGGIIIGKTAQDEFGFGGFSMNVGKDFEIPLNPFDAERSTGGSSGGAAGLAQKASFPHIAIGESTGGSIVEPASFCGVYGFCPTFGRVSNYGVIHFSNSLDKLGPLAKSPADIALMMRIIAGHDPKESTTLDEPVPNYTSSKDVKGLKIGVVKEALGEGTADAVKSHFWEKLKGLESEGASYEEFSLKLPITHGLAVYYILGTSEASTNLAKFCGMRYGKEEKLEGNFNEYFTKVRSDHFGDEAKRRIMLGTFARMAGTRDAYYLKAAKVRTKIIEEYKKAFKKFDVLMTPTVPILPPKLSEVEKLSVLQQYMIDILTVGPNVAGLPHMNVPAGSEKGLPVGALVIGDHLAEEKVLRGT